jgi:hypothetical protein
LSKKIFFPSSLSPGDISGYLIVIDNVKSGAYTVKPDCDGWWENYFDGLF